MPMGITLSLVSAFVGARLIEGRIKRRALRPMFIACVLAGVFALTTLGRALDADLWTALAMRYQ